MATKQKYRAIPRQLTAQDKEFIKLIEAGEKKTIAFKQAYPDHQTVTRYMDAVKDGQDAKQRQWLASLVTMAAKNKLQTRHMQTALVTYQSSMDMFSELSVETAIELVQGAKSEKVRADLAIEGMRHKVGTPVQKIALKEDKRVIITFGNPEANNRTVIDADADF